MAASRARGQGVAIDLCPRCRKEILPREPGPQLRGVHRGKEEPPADPKAERKRASKARRQARRAGITRSDVRAHGIVGAARLFIQTRVESAPVDEECPECLRRQGKAA